MDQTALFADDTPPPAKRTKRARAAAKDAPTAPALSPRSAPMGEVATIERAEGVSAVFSNEYPNPSKVLRDLGRGQGLGFYDTVLKTDSDVAGFCNDLTDDVLHYPLRVTPASDQPEHILHWRFVRMALERVRNRQVVIRHGLSAFARGFAVLEKMFDIVDRGEWAGAVVYSELLDRPQKWFTFDLQRRLRFKTTANWSGELVDPEKFAVNRFGTCSPYGDPAIDYIIFPWQLKRHATKNQALWFEKWAQPTPKAGYQKSSDPKINRQNMEEALKVAMAFQSDSAIALPQGMEISLIETARNGNISFESYIQMLTEMESRLLTGQILSSMGSEGGSHALGKVHEKREANKVEMLANWVSEFLRELFCIQLVIRNFGPQDAYPGLKIMAKSPASRQAEATLVQQYQSAGFALSKSAYAEYLDVIGPESPDDELLPSTTVKPGQVLPVNSQLAAPANFRRASEIALAAHATLHRDARVVAQEHRAALDQVSKTAVKKARPAITKVVKSLGKAAAKAGKKNLSHVRRRDIYGGLQKAAGLHDLGAALHGMLKPGAVKLADGGEDAPPDISVAAKLALALQMLAIAERIYQAAQSAPDGTTGPDFADSLTGPDGGVDQAFGNMFDAVHGTNVSSIAIGQLRQKLADPKFRAAYPYVMIVSQPDARAAHGVMDGFVLSAEEARYSPFLPPYDFGCRCIPVPISAADAVERGLTGASPVGVLDDFLQGKGLTPNPSGFGYRLPGGPIIRPGAPIGFEPAYPGTDDAVQLQALRDKAEELRREDPEAWAGITTWLKWLFDGTDPLRDTPQ